MLQCVAVCYSKTVPCNAVCYSVVHFKYGATTAGVASVGNSTVCCSVLLRVAMICRLRTCRTYRSDEDKSNARKDE